MNYSSCEVSDQNMSGLLQQPTSAKKKVCVWGGGVGGGRKEKRERGERDRKVIGIRSTTTPLSLIHTYIAGLDYVPTTTELTFQPSTTSVCGNVGQVKDDVIVEGAESFFLLLSSQNERVHIQYQHTAQVTIEDDDGMCVCVKL